jgi:hypothetical protein
MDSISSLWGQKTSASYVKKASSGMSKIAAISRVAAFAKRLMLALTPELSRAAARLGVMVNATI